MNDKYKKIINLPHHTSQKRKQMSRSERAAQFAPFAALSGHDAAIKETARITERRIELSESEKSELDRRFSYLLDNLSEYPTVKITYFKDDERKDGGRYEIYEGVIKKVDLNKGMVYVENDEVINISDIINIEVDIFSYLNDE